MSDVNVTVATAEQITVTETVEETVVKVGHPHAASAVSVDPSGLLVVTTDNVQAALAELDAASGTGASEDSIWIPAGDFSAVSGSPSFADAFGSGWGMWLLDQTNVEGVSSSVITPDDWTTYDVDFYIASSATGDVYLRRRFQSIGDGEALSGDTVVNQTTTIGTANQLKVFTIQSGVAAAADKMTKVTVFRIGSQGADTLAADMGLAGVRLRKAS